MASDAALIVAMYERMLVIRQFEEQAIALFERGHIRGNVHPCIGQEAVSVGVCANLRRDDYMTSTHRGHGNCLAKGADPKRMMAELLGRKTGYCKGKGGSMHIADFDGGNLGANGIVGGGFPIATGAGIGIQNRGTDQVVVCFFGDGAANQGTFHESLNLAALWKLPVLYVCENNQYALSTPLRESVGLPELSERARGYGIPGARVDGNDVLAVHAAAAEAVRRARAGEGPTLLDCLTYRFFGHFTGDKGHGITYRTKQEMEEWRNRCPIARLRRHLLGAAMATDAQLEKIETQAQALIAAAAQYGLDSPWPSPEEALEDVFA
ncbi:MAG: pyruvate dehydrogenase component, alpha subunit [candidate division NC10 bacterium]|jgi:pyruvate dehydrogenase E1 component alpha subunit|nr:pyruvate dehydrogenase component, alpha subunit [candidate division NC10 bacterium]MBS1117411.1 pyruvate dehydrogenase component, alpha subunit [candidate division NC10 bacterium]